LPKLKRAGSSQEKQPNSIKAIEDKRQTVQKVVGGDTKVVKNSQDGGKQKMAIPRDK
jgi:hypothetical protein